MTTFSVSICDSTREQRFDDVLAFQSADDSGGFSLWAGHVDFIALANAGISRLRKTDGELFLAAPRLLVEMRAGTLLLSDRRIFTDTDANRLDERLRDWLSQDQQARQTMSSHLQNLEQELKRQLLRGEYASHPSEPGL